ncbi:hypothetical protein ACWGH2_29800 [Streptomyces sp. NPDC054871]
MQAITVRGEDATHTNIPVVADRRASEGKYLGLFAANEPPEGAWFATYTVDAPNAGVHELTAVATAPVEVPHTEAVASYIQLAVNDGPVTEIARSQPYWYESKPAWGDLSTLRLGDVELRCGENTLTFSVAEPTVVDDATVYVLRLDHFTLTPAEHPTLREAFVGDPRTGLGTYRPGEDARLTLRLGGHATRPQRVRYTVTDYFGKRAAFGAATIAEGEAETTVGLPRLPPGNYRVEAALTVSNATPASNATRPPLTRHFACLPEERPAPDGPANRFGVNAFVSSLVPPSRLDAFAAAMKDMGVGCVRDGNSWPAAEPAPGAYDTAHYDRVTKALRRQGLSAVEVISPAPEWAMTDASLPLPADLRVAYHYARHLAAKRDTAATPHALQLSNEPDVDVTRSTGDAHAAYVKAAALGIADADRPPLTVLPGIAEAGHFQRLMLENDVVRYADVWAFHGYPDPADQDEPEFPGAADEQHELSRRYGADLPLWMTECGVFLDAAPQTDLEPAQQAVQARYLVRSMVEGLAAGNERQFWFGGPPVHDDGVYFGLLSRDFQPWPAYSAFAALTSLLGEAHFAGPVAGLPSPVVGHAFDTGRDLETATVLWAPHRSRIELPLSGGQATVFDIMGKRVTTVTPSAAGTVGVDVSRDPVYVVTNGGGTPRERPAPRPRGRARLSPAEHIVLSQRYHVRNAAPGKDNGDAAPPLGYRLGARTRMSLDVHNFNDTPQTVTVTAHPAEGWSARNAGSRTVDVPPMGRESVEFTITAGRAVERRVDHRLAFTARLATDAGGTGATAAVPPSVSWVQLKSRYPRRF